MKLYWGKHTCAIGIHILLEEIGEPYALEEVDVQGRANTRSPFKDMNPKQKVPVLIRDDGSMLTEYGTIAAWLASTHKAANLAPFEDLERQTRMYEAMDYLIGTLHGLAFPRIFFPERFAPAAKDDASVADQVKAQGREMANTGFAILGEAFGAGPYVVGEAFTIADTAFFYAERWCDEAGVTLPANLAAHLARMKARPSVQRVLAAWGEA
jgi:glutathione S-transferase